MKLLMITPYFYPKVGGLENYAYNIARGLKKTFHWDVVIITSNHEGKKNVKEVVHGLTVYRLAPLFKLSNTPINPFWYFAIKRIVRSEKPDIINAHAPVPFMADIASYVHDKIPFILTYHAGSMKKGSLIYDMLIGVYEKIFLGKLFRKSKIVICSSKFVEESLVKKFHVKHTVITPAVDTTIFKPSKVKKGNVVLFVGRYANVYRLKGLHDLLTAMKSIPNAQLHIVGEKSAIHQKNVTFLGVKSGKELVMEMQKSKVLVLPSIAPMESFGMVLIEAMSCKTPVIGTQMGGIPEIIMHGGNGILVPIKSPHALKHAIQKILDNDVLAKKMGEAGFLKVKNTYLWKYKVRDTHKLFVHTLQ